MFPTFTFSHLLSCFSQEKFRSHLNSFSEYISFFSGSDTPSLIADSMLGKIHWETYDISMPNLRLHSAAQINQNSIKKGTTKWKSILSAGEKKFHRSVSFENTSCKNLRSQKDFISMDLNKDDIFSSTELKLQVFLFQILK